MVTRSQLGTWEVRGLCEEFRRHRLLVTLLWRSSAFANIMPYLLLA